MRAWKMLAFAALATAACQAFLDTTPKNESDGGEPSNVDSSVVPDGTAAELDAPADGDTDADGNLYVAAVMSDGPVAYWHFEEATGPLRDSAGNSAMTVTRPEAINRKLDELAIYNRALSPTKIFEHYKAAKQ